MSRANRRVLGAERRKFFPDLHLALHLPQLRRLEALTALCLLLQFLDGFEL